LRLDVRSVRGERRNPTLLSLLPELPERGVIVCATPHEVDAVCAVIGAGHGSVCRIHAAMPPADRAMMRDRFALASGRALLVTTSALAPDVGLPGLGETTASEPRIGFGLEVLMEDVGFVLHHHAPASLEQYLREVSALRAPEALALLFYDSSHRSMNQAVLEQQRLPALKLEPFTRALEAALATGKPVKHEALAFQIGVSRRTSERFIALLVDAGVARRDATGIALQHTGLELAKHSAELARALESLQRGDLGRLASVERYAESAACKRRVLGDYFGEAAAANCGRCASCRSVGGVERKTQAR
jgi:superfamily II DNA helicase RecQ